MSKGQLKDALTEFVKNKVMQRAIVCKVDSLDVFTKSVYCIPVGDYADVQQARFIADPNKDGLFILPKVGSTVVVDFLDNGSAYIAMFSEVDEIHLAGVNYGGIPKAADVANKLSTIENKINTLISALTAWVPVTGDGGAALKVAVAGFIASTLTPTTQGAIESNNVFHGDGT